MLRALKTVGKKMGVVNFELEEFKTCIMKVPILAQCLTAERAKFRPVAASAASAESAASTASTPLLSRDDESKCSPENLYQGIRALSEEEFNKLLNCYLFFLDNSQSISNLNTQIEGAEKKEFYQKICSILNDILYEDRERIFTEHGWVRRDLMQFEFPSDTHRILSGLVNLAGLFKKKGDYNRALTLYEEIVARSKRVLGEDHPDTLIYLNDIANLFYMKGDYNRALLLYEDLLAKKRQVLGEEGTGASLGGRSKNKRNHKNKSFRSTRRRRYSRARGGKKIAASSSKTIKRRRKNAR